MLRIAVARPLGGAVIGKEIGGSFGTAILSFSVTGWCHCVSRQQASSSSEQQAIGVRGELFLASRLFLLGFIR